jgi:hypothetical protein
VEENYNLASECTFPREQVSRASEQKRLGLLEKQICEEEQRNRLPRYCGFDTTCCASRGASARF